MRTTSSWTKANTRTMVMQLIDDPSNVMWSATNLDLLLTLVYDQLWHRMLEANPLLNASVVTVSAANITSPGYVTIGTTTGLTTQRIKRVLEVQIDGQTYYPGSWRELVFDGTEVKVSEARGQYQWIQLGQRVYLFPLQTTSDILLRVSELPTRFTGLSTDGTTITWPDGHEDALVLKAAGVALGKGDKEDAGRLLGLADEAWKELHNTITRPSGGPTVPFYTGAPEQWGGE
jgi:hypothetical protein